MKHKNKIIAGIVIVTILAVAFFFGGNTKKTVTENTTEPQNTENITDTEVLENSGETIEEPQEDTSANPEEKPQKADNTPMTAEEKIKYAEEHFGAKEEPKNIQPKEEINEQETKPAPVDPNDTVVTDNEQKCTLSVRCDTVLDNLSWLEKEKVGIVPKDGIIYPEQEVVFYDGESVFNVLLREMKKNKIHMEFVNTPIYNSAYIEGIGNLYEFDCGELSGWMYKVNGWFPNYGCSQYIVHNGDKIEWVYTCNLGVDVGGSNSTKKE